MTEISGPWTETQLEEFLKEARIPIRLAVHRGDGSLWTVALWFRYGNGSFECVTPANAAVVAFLRNDSEVAFDISTNQPPYRGVRGQGLAALSTDEGAVTLQALADRYVGDTESPLVDRVLSAASSVIRIRIQPTEMYSWDFTD